MTAEFLAGFILATFLAGLAWVIKTKRDEREALRKMPDTWTPPDNRPRDYDDPRRDTR